MRWEATFGILVATAFIAVIGSLVAFEISSHRPGVYPAVPDGALTDAQTLAISTMTSYSEKLSTWSIFIIGGTAALSSQLRAGNRTFFVMGVLLSISFIAAFSSIFFSQIVLETSFRMLSLRQNPLSNDQFYSTLRLSYFSLLVSVAAIILAGLYRICSPKPRGVDSC